MKAKSLNFKEDRQELASHIWLELAQHFNFTDKKEVLALINVGIGNYLALPKEIIVDNK